MSVWPNGISLVEPHVVEEVRGNWVRMKLVLDNPNPRKKAPARHRTVWVNFDTVNWYQVVSQGTAKPDGE
jgi:hypothetical protein